MRPYSGSVLVVDDHKDNRRILSRYLERDGHQVVCVENGEVAIEQISNKEFDLVLLDILLPGINGVDVLRYIKDDPKLKKIPVIVLSALGDMDSVVKCIELGADDYITKPFNLVLLKARINASLEKKLLREQEQAILADEKRQTEEALLESETQLETVISSAPVVLFAFNEKGIFTTIQGKGLDQVGHWTERVGDSLFDLFDEDPVVLELVDRALKGEEVYSNIELEGTIWEVRVSPIIDIEGKFKGATGVAMDATRRTQIELEREQLYNALELSHERLRALSTRLVDVQETERQFLAHELHDEVGQSLTGLKLSLELGMKDPENGQNQHLQEAHRLSLEVLSLVREMSLNLRPGMLDDLGLVPTLQWHFDRYKKQTNIQVEFQQEKMDHRFPTRIETAVYRLVQEALTNCARYAEVDRVVVRLWEENKKLNLEIRDQGKGFDLIKVLSSSNSSGLAGMQDRVRLLDGEIRIESEKGRGTRIWALFPIEWDG